MANLCLIGDILQGRLFFVDPAAESGLSRTSPARPAPLGVIRGQVFVSGGGEQRGTAALTQAFLSTYMSYQPATAFAAALTAYLISHGQAHLDGTVQLVAFYSKYRLPVFGNPAKLFMLGGLLPSVNLTPAECMDAFLAARSAASASAPMPLRPAVWFRTVADGPDSVMRSGEVVCAVKLCAVPTPAGAGNAGPAPASVSFDTFLVQRHTYREVIGQDGEIKTMKPSRCVTGKAR